MFKSQICVKSKILFGSKQIEWDRGREVGVVMVVGGEGGEGGWKHVGYTYNSTVDMHSVIDFFNLPIKTVSVWKLTGRRLKTKRTKLHRTRRTN